MDFDIECYVNVCGDIIMVGMMFQNVSHDFQESTTELACNWGEFGMPGSNIPGQTVLRYEVAIGVDPTQEFGV